MTKKNFHQKNHQANRKRASITASDIPSTPLLVQQDKDSMIIQHNEISESFTRGTSMPKERGKSSLVSAGRYTYVQKDLRLILLLACIMVAALIVLHFVPAIGG